MIFLKYSKLALRPHEKLFFYRHDDKSNRHLLVSRLPHDTNIRNDKVNNIQEILDVKKTWKDGPGLVKFKDSD